MTEDEMKQEIEKYEQLADAWKMRYEEEREKYTDMTADAISYYREWQTAEQEIQKYNTLIKGLNKGTNGHGILPEGLI